MIAIINKNTVRLLILLVVIILAIGLMISAKSFFSSDLSGKVTVDDKHEFQVEIADTDAERAEGLMFRDELPGTEGMLFVYDSPVGGNFWMKNTYIPLDMVFIDENLEIVYIVRDAQPCTADPCQTYGPSDEFYSYVLEINGGLSDELGISEGARVELDIPSD